MFCAQCGSEVAANAAFCGKCGTPVSGTAGAIPELKRPALVTVLAVLNFIGATFCFLLAIVAVLSLAASDVGAPQAAAGLLVGGLGTLELACGVGLWKVKPYGRTFQLVFAWIGLLAFPVGTIISILVLVFLYKPGVKALFAGKHAAELTPEESAQLTAIYQSSLATIIVILLVLVGAVATVGIVAAIAIPSLLNARTSANEASAIGSLRTINSAQAAFAASCGNGSYAPTLAALATPPPGQVGFLSTDLAVDPTVRSGYTIALSGGDPVPNAPAACNGTSVVSSYFASAEPVVAGNTGTRFFATNQDGTLYQSSAPIPVARGNAPIEGTPIP